MSQRWFNRHDEAGFEINSDRIIWQTDQVLTTICMNCMNSSNDQDGFIDVGDGCWRPENHQYNEKKSPK